MAKSINIYKSISDYNDGYDERKNISLSLIIDDEEDEIVDSHVKTGFVTFTAEEAGSTIGLYKLSTYQLLEYTTDQVVNPSEMCYPVWKKMDVNTIITLANAGDEVYIRGLLSGDNSLSDYTQFKMTGKIAASGNCNVIWNYNNLNAPLRQYCGYSMFQGCTSLTTSPELPATILAGNCYNSMFLNCTSLTTTPELPATTLADGCYDSMFLNCTSLTTSPELPATTLANYCYYYMFYGCTSLTTTPELPATKLANDCYDSMFKGCTSLTKAPELPATTLAYGCYQSMFYGCKSLTTAPELPATTLASWCYREMFSGCTSLTTAPELPATTLAYGCYRFMFNGCTSLTTAPELPATTLAKVCYGSMFNGCTNLTTAPELPATTLTYYCYYYMFYGCSKLNYIKCLATDISESNCTYNWVDGVSPTGTFVKVQDTSWSTGYNGIPYDWTVIEEDIEVVEE